MSEKHHKTSRKVQRKLAQLQNENLSEDEAKAMLWERGNLDWKLKGNQKKVKEAFKNAGDKVHVVLCSRRFGKSYILCSWAIEICLQIPNAIIKYAAPEKQQVEEIITDIIPNFILNDCPEHLKPEWREQKKHYIFPNGSKIQIAGTNKDKGNKLRGGRAHLCIVDEAQDHNYLSYVINSVLAPTIDTTNGFIVVAGTPNPLEPAHEFHIDYIAPLEAEDKLIKFTVYESPLYEERGEAFIKELEHRYRHRGGLNAPEFLCEYMCEIAKDSQTFVIPEFNKKTKKSFIKEIEEPAYFDSYISMDIGFSHLTGILFGYYNFDTSQIVILDEYIINGPQLTTEYLAEKLNYYESQLFKKPPFLRISDNNNPILINDLLRLHDIPFIPTAKDNKRAQVNQLRILWNQGRIIINPRCKNLIYHMENAKWKPNKDEFQELKDSPLGDLKGGHADLLDALVYLVRNVNLNKNPYPDNYNKPTGWNVFNNNSNKNNIPSSISNFMNRMMGKNN